MKQLAMWVALTATLHCGQPLRATGVTEASDEALGAHVNEFVQKQSAETHVPGTALVVVKSRHPILAEGYG